MMVNMLQFLVATPSEAVATLILAIKLMADANGASIEEAVKEFEQIYRSLEPSDEHEEQQTLQ